MATDSQFSQSGRLSSGGQPNDPNSSIVAGTQYSTFSQSQGVNPDRSWQDQTQSLKREIQTHKENAMRKIETLVLSIIDSVMEGRFPTIERPRLISNSRDMVKLASNPGLSTKVVFGGRSSKTFAMQLHVMATLYKMMQTGQTSTIRDMYYENLNFYGNQNRLCATLKYLSLFLQVNRNQVKAGRVFRFI